MPILMLIIQFHILSIYSLLVIENIYLLFLLITFFFKYLTKI